MLWYLSVSVYDPLLAIRPLELSVSLALASFKDTNGMSAELKLKVCFGVRSSSYPTLVSGLAWEGLVMARTGGRSRWVYEYRGRPDGR